MSQDKTRNMVAEFARKYPFVKLIDNKKKITPVAFNVGIKAAKGEIIVLMGAHAHYEKKYVSSCVFSLIKNKADNVGGKAIILPGSVAVSARAIALSLSASAGSGGAVYKTSRGTAVREVDTVFGGCYKKDIFKKIGYFNERLRRTQDLEFNIRLKKNGGKIIFDPAINAYYYSKSTDRDFFNFNFNYGKWVIYSWRITCRPLKMRQYIPFFFVSCTISVFIYNWQFGLIVLALYLLAIMAASAKSAIQEKDLRLTPYIAIALVVRHFGYGLGSLIGLIHIFLQPFKREF